MKLVEINDQSAWDGFVAAQSWSPFTQSWAWGEFQKSQGHPVKRFFLVGAGFKPAPTMVCQFIFYKKFFSGYWFAPRGPVFGSVSDKRKIFFSFLKLLSVGAIHELPLLAGPSLFDRFEPFIEEDQVLIQEMMRTGLRHRHAINPSTTFLVDLMKTENELLAQMHPKTRYNIRVADKHGVTVREARGKEDIEIFLRLLQETAERDQFMSQPAEYLRALWKVLSPSGMIRLHFAERNGEVLAAHMNVVYGDTMTYLHGASSSTHREMMAPYALHWAVMSEAKREGYGYYDFWGCNPSDKNHFDYKTTWEGMTRFKEGWGGQKISLVGTWDLPRHSFLYKMVIR